MAATNLDLGPSVTAEHLARRLLPPLETDFVGLDEYTRHSEDSKGHVTAPKFDAHLMEWMKAESQKLKQARLQREDVIAEGKRGGRRNRPMNEERPG